MEEEKTTWMDGMEWRKVDRLGFALVCCFLASLCVLVVGERMENKSKTTRLVGFTFIFYTSSTNFKKK
jgi:hypothetical protein